MANSPLTTGMPKTKKIDQACNRAIIVVNP